MNSSQKPRRTIPGHVIALAALAGVAALLAFALNDRASLNRAAAPERVAPAPSSRIELDHAWATAAQQKVLGTGRLTASEKRVGTPVESWTAAPAEELTSAARPTRTVTHVGVSPRRADTSGSGSRNASTSYTGPSLANQPPPGD